MATYCKRFLLCLLCITCLVLPLSSCSKYREEKSTAEQARVVATVGDYEVRQELIDFFYFNYRTEIDGGDTGVWQGPQADEYHEKLLRRVADAVGDLYGIFALSASYGIDPFGERIDRLLSARIETVIDSFDTRRDYIAHLESLHMTDAVYRLLTRSYVCREEMLSASQGVGSTADEDLLAFCRSEDVFCMLSLTVSFGDGMRAWAEERAAQLEAMLAEKPSDAGFLQVARQSATAHSAGTYVTLRQYRLLVGDGEARPARGDTTAPLFDRDQFMILRCAEKSETYVLERSSDILLSYMEYKTEQYAVAYAQELCASQTYMALSRSDLA